MSERAEYSFLTKRVEHQRFADADFDASRPNGVPNPYDANGNQNDFATAGKKRQVCIELDPVDLLNKIPVVDSRVTQIGRASHARST